MQDVWMPVEEEDHKEGEAQEESCEEEVGRGRCANETRLKTV